MRIGIVIGRIGGVDGVALETEKWIEVLRKQGHEIFILTGELEAPMEGVTLFEPLSFEHPDCVQDQQDAFFDQTVDEKELQDSVEHRAARIERKILEWIQQSQIEVLLSENSTTLPCHLTMGLALKNVIEKTGIRAVAHDHDFAWERGKRYASRYGYVRQIIQQCFPPILPNLKHAVINTNCYNILYQKTGEYPVMVPNVMDFSKPFGCKDDYNCDLATVLGLGEDDIPLFQITRIVRRKGIETAIELVEKLNDSRVKLFITGYDKDGGQEYCRELEQQVQQAGLASQVFFVNDLFDNVRTFKDGKKIYSLSDGYALSRAITYFSTYEGFGNGYLEAILAGKPVFVNNYQPVYWKDIGSKGFRTVQIEDNKLTEEAVEEVRRIIYDDELCTEIGDYNFKLGKKYFSFEVLENKLSKLFSN